jgi:hypothetical protein
MRRITMRALIAMALVGIASPALAQTVVNTSIQSIRTGWNAELFAIVTADPIVNPANCPTPDGYISEISNPGYNTYYTAAIAAYMGGRSVTVAVDNAHCGAAGRPKLIGINLN